MVSAGQTGIGFPFENRYTIFPAKNWEGLPSEEVCDDKINTITQRHEYIGLS